MVVVLDTVVVVVLLDVVVNVPVVVVEEREVVVEVVTDVVDDTLVVVLDTVVVVALTVVVVVDAVVVVDEIEVVVRVLVVVVDDTLVVVLDTVVVVVLLDVVVDVPVVVVVEREVVVVVPVVVVPVVVVPVVVVVVTDVVVTVVMVTDVVVVVSDVVVVEIVVVVVVDVVIVVVVVVIDVVVVVIVVVVVVTDVVVVEVVGVVVGVDVNVDDSVTVSVVVADEVAVDVADDVADDVAVDVTVEVAVVVSSPRVVHNARSRNCRANASQYLSSFSAAANGIDRPPFFRKEQECPSSQLHFVSRRDERSTVLGAFAKSKTKRSMSGKCELGAFFLVMTSMLGHFGYGPGPSDFSAEQASPRSHTLSLRQRMERSAYVEPHSFAAFPFSVRAFMQLLKSAASVTSFGVSSESKHPHIDWQHAHTFLPALDSAFTPLVSASSSSSDAAQDLLAMSTKGVPLFPRFLWHLDFSASSVILSQSSIDHQFSHQPGGSAAEHATASAKHDLPASEMPATVSDFGCAALYVHVSAFQNGTWPPVTPSSVTRLKLLVEVNVFKSSTRL